MGEKSEKKKQFILEKARMIFAERGFKDVTMKDIVDACGISRGGLYLYFESTAQIFYEVLRMETGDTDENMSESIRHDSSASEILGLFLEEQKKEIMHSEGEDLTVAKYEYYLSNSMPDRENTMKCTFDEATDVLSQLIEDGVGSGEFICDNSRIAAQNIMFVLEGLKISYRTMRLDEYTINKQLSYLWGGLLA